MLWHVHFIHYISLDFLQNFFILPRMLPSISLIVRSQKKFGGNGVRFWDEKCTYFHSFASKMYGNTVKNTKIRARVASFLVNLSRWLLVFIEFLHSGMIKEESQRVLKNCVENFWFNEIHENHCIFLPICHKFRII